MKYLVTGCSGQLGFDIANILKKDENNIVLTPTSKELDITRAGNTINYINENKPDVIFHCAAYTAVDKAEEDKEICSLVNSYGTSNIVIGAQMVNAKLIYISTDYVFDGKKGLPYNIDDEVNPINWYGKTKYNGEKLVSKYPNSFIVRTSWVFGINGNNFVKTMLRLSETRDEISVVSDQIGSPTYTKDLAELLVKLADSTKYGVYHATNEGYTTWFEFAKYIFEVANKKVNVLPIETKDYKTLANRPIDSRLSKSCITNNGFDLLPDWHESVEKYVKSLK